MNSFLCEDFVALIKNVRDNFISRPLTDIHSGRRIIRVNILFSLFYSSAWIIEDNHISSQRSLWICVQLVSKLDSDWKHEVNTATGNSIKVLLNRFASWIYSWIYAEVAHQNRNKAFSIVSGSMLWKYKKNKEKFKWKLANLGGRIYFRHEMKSTEHIRFGSRWPTLYFHLNFFANDP